MPEGRQRWDRTRIPNRAERAGRFTPHGAALGTELSDQGVDSAGIAKPSEASGRIHADPKIRVVERFDQYWNRTCVVEYKRRPDAYPVIDVCNCLLECAKRFLTVLRFEATDCGSADGRSRIGEC
ncbi:MAG: hypothetical protein QOG85_1640, partial [Gaiellaceae bacterium]|nr:hypothetical protein [Gaiellaceae bacterium]